MGKKENGMKKTVLVFAVAVMCALFSGNTIFSADVATEYVSGKVRTANGIALTRDNGLVTSVFILDQKLTHESDQHAIMHDLTSSTLVQTAHVAQQSIALSYNSNSEMRVYAFLARVLSKHLQEKTVVVMH